MGRADAGQGCEHCGGPMPAPRGGRPRRYCSSSCRTAAWARRHSADQPTPPSVEDAVRVILNSPTGTTEVLLGLAAQLRCGQRSGVANNQLIGALFTAYDAAIAAVMSANSAAAEGNPLLENKG